MKIPKARKLPSGAWFIQLRLDGESISITRPTQKECVAEAMAIKAGVIKHEVKRGTLRQCLNDYIRQNEKRLSPTTIRNYKSYRDNHFQSVMDTQVQKVDWQRAADDEKCSAKTLHNVWNLCSAAMAAKGFDIKIKLPTVQRTEMKWLTAEQIPIFLDAVNGHTSELVALLGLHSLRRSEIFGLTWDNVDLGAGMLYIRASRVIGEDGKVIARTTNKTRGSRRDVPIMIPRLREILENTKDKTGYVVHQHPNTPYDLINAICEKAGLPKVGIHGLRRSFASLGHHLGLSETEIMSIGGWDDYQTVHKFYVYLSDLDRKAAANKMAAFYDTGSKC